jgi:2-methylisocitrate lyase-like PEP mutase family enzyme
MASSPTDLQSQCDLMRLLHRPGAPLLLPNVWDVATAKAVVAAGFPVVATTSGGVAATLGYEDEEDAPADEMLAAAARIARGVEVPVTVDAEVGYGMQPADLRTAGITLTYDPDKRTLRTDDGSNVAIAVGQAR